MKLVIPDHLYAADGIPDHKGHDRCSVCKRPRTSCPDQLPATDPDAKALEARKDPT